MKKFVSLFIFAVGGFAFSTFSAEKPNIVLIIADDMGAEDCGPFGNKKIQTPNFDRLAREGMRFDRAFLTCSSCSPSRSSIITGRYPHTTGAEQLHWPLPKEQVTFVELLKKAGYWTAAAGKWHLGNQVRDRFDVIHDVGTAGFQLPTDPETTKVKAVVPPDPNVKYEHRLVMGIAADDIVRLANEEQADLIVIGTHGRTGLKRVLMGSVAESVMRLATCPVLIVKEGSKTPA